MCSKGSRKGFINHADPQAVYTALKETEQRATDVLPLWKLPALNVFSARQRKAAAAVALIRETTERLIAKCKDMVDDEEQVRMPTFTAQPEPTSVSPFLSSGTSASPEQVIMLSTCTVCPMHVQCAYTRLFDRMD